MRKTVLALCLVFASILLVGASDGFAQNGVFANESFSTKTGPSSFTCVPTDELVFEGFPYLYRYGINAYIPLSLFAEQAEIFNEFPFNAKREFNANTEVIVDTLFYSCDPELGCEQIGDLQTPVDFFFATNPDDSKATNVGNFTPGRKTVTYKKKYKYPNGQAPTRPATVISDLALVNWNKNTFILKLTGNRYIRVPGLDPDPLSENFLFDPFFDFPEQMPLFSTFIPKMGEDPDTLEPIRLPFIPGKGPLVSDLFQQVIITVNTRFTVIGITDPIENTYIFESDLFLLKGKQNATGSGVETCDGFVYPVQDAAVKVTPAVPWLPPLDQTTGF